MSHDGHTIPERDHREASASLRCAECEAWTERRLPGRGSRLPQGFSCGTCGTPLTFDLEAHLGEDGALDGCPACGYHTLCIQKDVNPRLGVVLVVVTFGVLLLSGLPLPWMLAALVALAALDWLLLRLVVKRLLICYRCKAQFRGFPPGPRCRPFDLATWEAHDDVAGTGDAP